jgi:ABC-2 type transport system ATP-binding protein
VSPLMEAAAPAIRLRGIARRFGQRWVLRGLDLDGGARRGAGADRPQRQRQDDAAAHHRHHAAADAGTATVFGCDTVKEPEGIRESIGLLGHNNALYDDLTASENLVFSLRMAGRAADARPSRPR